MLIDTHCHVNMMVKKKFDVEISQTELLEARTIISQAHSADIETIINVGTSFIESLNCVTLAKNIPNVWAAVGIHPNDCTSDWKQDFSLLTKMVTRKKENRIVAIGECGLDYHYPNYNKMRQSDAFKAHIELALENDLALVIHTRDARDDTASILDIYKNDITRCVIHCFSEDQDFADFALDAGFKLGLGGTITYPKNDTLRSVAQSVPLSSIVLETDAPFLPPQNIRGKQNHPREIAVIAHYLATLRALSYKEVAEQTTKNAQELFQLPNPQ